MPRTALQETSSVFPVWKMGTASLIYQFVWTIFVPSFILLMGCPRLFNNINDITIKIQPDNNKNNTSHSNKAVTLNKLQPQRTSCLPIARANSMWCYMSITQRTKYTNLTYHYYACGRSDTIFSPCEMYLAHCGHNPYQSHSLSGMGWMAHICTMAWVAMSGTELPYRTCAFLARA